MTPLARIKPLKYRAIFLSDVHLGSKDCKAAYLLDFLKSTESEYLYLLGDIIDLWSMSRSLYWPQQHNNVIRTILGKAKHGTRVVYVPGNHDHPIRDHDGMVFGNVEIRNEHVHTTADGRRLLLLHGDEFDSVIQCGPIARHLGNCAYDVLLLINRCVNYTRKRFGLPYWSLATYLKHRVRGAARHIQTFEQAVVREAARRGVDGLVCGHIHHPEIMNTTAAVYCNDGDWVENCTALVETHDGSLELLRWVEQTHTVKSLTMSGYDGERKIA